MPFETGQDRCLLSFSSGTSGEPRARASANLGLHIERGQEGIPHIVITESERPAVPEPRAHQRGAQEVTVGATQMSLQDN